MQASPVEGPGVGPLEEAPAGASVPAGPSGGGALLSVPGSGEASDDAVLKLKGLPYSTNEQQILDFFAGFKVKTVAFVDEPDGRPSGLAFAEFVNKDEALKALSKNGDYIGERYVRLLHVPKSEMEEQVKLGTLAIPGAAAKLRSRLLRSQPRVGYMGAAPQLFVPTLMQSGTPMPMLGMPQSAASSNPGSGSTPGSLLSPYIAPGPSGLATVDARLWQQQYHPTQMALHQQFAGLGLGGGQQRQPITGRAFQIVGAGSGSHPSSQQYLQTQQQPQQHMQGSLYGHMRPGVVQSGSNLHSRGSATSGTLPHTGPDGGVGGVGVFGPQLSGGATQASVGQGLGSGSGSHALMSAGYLPGAITENGNQQSARSPSLSIMHPGHATHHLQPAHSNLSQHVALQQMQTASPMPLGAGGRSMYSTGPMATYTHAHPQLLHPHQLGMTTGLNMGGGMPSMGGNMGGMMQPGTMSRSPAAVPLATPTSATVKVRGLPYRSSPAEILAFFAGYQYLPDSLQLGLDSAGRPSGEAWLSFASPAEGARACKELNRRYLGSRYIELTTC